MTAQVDVQEVAQAVRTEAIGAAIDRFTLTRDLNTRIAEIERLGDLHARSACTHLLMGNDERAERMARQVEADDRLIEALRAERRAL